MACAILERISGLEPATHRGITLKGKNLLTCPSRESASLAEEICTPRSEVICNIPPTQWSYGDWDLIV